MISLINEREITKTYFHVDGIPKVNRVDDCCWIRINRRPNSISCSWSHSCHYTWMDLPRILSLCFRCTVRRCGTYLYIEVTYVHAN